MSDLADRLRRLRRDAPRQLGDAPRATGDAPRATGDAPRATGDAPRATGDAPRATGDAPRATRDAQLANGETLPASDEVSRDVAQAEASFDPAPPAWLRQRLTSAAPAPAHEASLGPPARLAISRGARGEFAHRDERFDERHRHGAWSLADVDHASCEALALVAKDEGLGLFPLRESVFLDVETTGLSGGAGTISFLVALGRFEGSSFHLWQGFLRDPSEEHALLEEVAHRIDAAAGIVSFFGKSFDRHRLEDKMRVFGVDAPFEDRPHLDLYWPIQRLYGAAFPDGRLCTAERELAGVARTDDWPGSRAPEAWFDFLAGRSHRLEGVFRHNRDDVLSLVVLAAHVGRALCETDPGGGPLPGPAGARAAGLARLFARRGRRAEALQWIELALARGAGGAGGARELAFERGELVLRLGRTADARELFEVLADGGDLVAARALLELAKLHEHRSNDPRGAAEACARLRRLAQGALTGASFARAVRGLAQREERLAAKLARSPA